MPLIAFKDAAAIVSSKGQVVIPGEIRRQLNLVQGSVVRFVVEGDTVRLVPSSGDVRRLKGRLAKPAKPVSVDRMNELIEARRHTIGLQRDKTKPK